MFHSIGSSLADPRQHQGSRRTIIGRVTGTFRIHQPKSAAADESAPETEAPREPDAAPVDESAPQGFEPSPDLVESQQRVVTVMHQKPPSRPMPGVPVNPDVAWPRRDVVYAGPLVLPLPTYTGPVRPLSMKPIAKESPLSMRRLAAESPIYAAMLKKRGAVRPGFPEFLPTAPLALAAGGAR